MKDTSCFITSPVLRRMAVVLAFLLFSAYPAWARPLVNSDIFVQVLQEAHALFAEDTEGVNADYIPELAKIPSELFGLALVTVDGRVFVAGDADYVFSIQSVSKPFTAALVLQEYDAPEILVERIGVEPTGLPFNSVLAVELHASRSVNPLVNAGAMAAVSLVPAEDKTERFLKIKQFYEAMAGQKLKVIKEVYRSEAATNQSNRAIANLLKKYGRIYADPEEALDVYTRQCAIGVSARVLAMMGATLANGGVNPISKKQVLEARYVPKVLALMLTAGFYDESGRWAYEVGLPAKTGVGGGIVAVVPGEMAVAAFSPRLNQAGNSVRAMRAIEYVSQRLGLGLFQ
ncbi:glutaminase A [Desulfobotulus mexicanus]|uniref:Glutaminase n=1 Tax=Desulfobotulus mexicanus TaxID=2586642 RepID=A0A5Q4VG55_9BACT|nr:glutaminase A [Desulfobotulus mexicanus]TYT75928.1 glutaminase A [Desulfobotulus mexicanus]